tara:strand:- start:678 stop:1898 length:1221 start_codon:yes stop_codon:yes gene_type:complete
MFRSYLVMVGTLILLLVSAMASPARAVDRSFGPFSVTDDLPGVIILNGDIDEGSALNFRRALQAVPDARLVVLNSPGGLVQMGLLIADDVHTNRLSTYIPEGSGCYSACSYIFLAGAQRTVEGELGVHQIATESTDLVGAQVTISDIIDILSRFDTPPAVMSAMFRTPPDQMYVFSAEEIAKLDLNRTGESSELDETPSTIETPTEQTTSSARFPKKLSILEEFASRPNRIALFSGLDMFGDDISAERVADAAVCAGLCLAMDGRCKAFTFNTNPRIKRGPNCFLKSSSGRADGNSVAVSGLFLSAAEADPDAITLGTIDPQTALHDDIDLPGGDLSRRPHPTAKTPLDCRLACIDDKRCLAFTYLRRKTECWLKGTIGHPAYGKDMVTDVKSIETFQPVDILSLD